MLSNDTEWILNDSAYVFRLSRRSSVTRNLIPLLALVYRFPRLIQRQFKY